MNQEKCALSATMTQTKKTKRITTKLAETKHQSKSKNWKRDPGGNKRKATSCWFYLVGKILYVVVAS